MAGPAPTTSTSMRQRPTILVPLDGSSYSEAILGTVERLARPLGADVTLLMVGHPTLDPLTLLTGAGRALAMSAGPDAALRTAGTHLAEPVAAAMAGVSSLAQVEVVLRAYLQRCAAALPGVATTLVVDFADDPAAVIVARARQQHVDLIAMATHGRTGLLQHLTGSVTGRVIRSGVAPVVVLRP
jgi:nucleotide-binding universal stress UspA family protein